MPTGIIILLFLVLEDRATVGTDPSANIRFTKESDARVRHSFLLCSWENTTLLWKTQGVKPRVWAEPSEPKAPLLNGALPFAHGIITSNDDLV